MLVLSNDICITFFCPSLPLGVSESDLNFFLFKRNSSMHYEFLMKI